MRRIRQIKDDRRVGLCATTVGVRAGKIDRAAEMERAVRIYVDIKRFEIGRGVDEADVAGLHKVVGDDNVFLIGGDFDVVGADGGLDFIGIIKALDVVEVGDVERGDVVGRCERDCRSERAKVSDGIIGWD